MYTYYHIFSWVGDEQLKKDKPSESCRSISAEKNPLNLLSWLYSHWSSLEIYRSRLFNFTFKLIIRVIVINFVKNCPCCLKAYILVFIMWIKKSFYVSSEYRVVFLPPCYYCRIFELWTFSYLFTNKLKHLATVCRYTRIIISISHWTPLLISFIDFFICHLFNTSFIQISLFLWKVCNDTWSTYLFTCTCTVYNSMVRIKWEQTN